MKNTQVANISQALNQKNFFAPLIAPREHELERWHKNKRRIYSYLVNRCHSENRVRIAQLTIATHLNLCLRTVNGWIGVLQREGYIMGFFNGFNQTKTYVVSSDLFKREVRYALGPYIPALNLQIYTTCALFKKDLGIYKTTKRKPYYNFDYRNEVAYEYLIREPKRGPPVKPGEALAKTG